MDIKEIIQAWITSHNPTAEEKEIADTRLKICQQCPAYTLRFKFYICSDCGCPIPKKVFARNKESCPKRIWPI